MRAQAAMEYLMTYGWALLIVVIVGVALWSLGVFNVGAGNVVKLSGVNSVQLIDANTTSDGNVTMILGVRKQMKDVTIGLGANSDCTISPSPTNGIYKPGVKYTVTCNGAGTGNALSFSIKYKDVFSNMEHTETGTLTGLSS